MLKVCNLADDPKSQSKSQSADESNDDGSAFKFHELTCQFDHRPHG